MQIEIEQQARWHSFSKIVLLISLMLHVSTKACLSHWSWCGWFNLCYEANVSGPLHSGKNISLFFVVVVVAIVIYGYLKAFPPKIYRGDLINLYLMNPKGGSHREPAPRRIWLVDPHTKRRLRAPIGWPGFVLLSSHFSFCCVFIDEPHFVRRRSNRTVLLETGQCVRVFTFISDLQNYFFF